MGYASLSESPEEEEDNDRADGPDRGNSSPQNTPGPTFTDDWLGKPRKRTQTLPTFNCPLTGMAAKADILSRWSRGQDIAEENSGTLSEDIFKILDLRSPGSFIRGSQITTKEEENRLTAEKESENIGSFSTVGSEKPEPNSDSHPALAPAHQRTPGSLAQQINSGAEQTDSQQLVDRWENPATTPNKVIDKHPNEALIILVKLA